MKHKFATGDKIVYLGTKEGGADTEGWKNYFERYGIKRGSRGTITSIYDNEDIFIHQDGRPILSGRLFPSDIMLESEYIDKFETKVSKKELNKKIKEIIKEIKSNKEFLKAFKDIDIEKEIRSWSKGAILNWSIDKK